MNQTHRIPEGCIAFMLLLSSLLSGCSPLNAYQHMLPVDYEPPMIVDTETTESNIIHITCTEPVHIDPESFFITPDTPIDSIICRDQYVIIRTIDPLQAGICYQVSGELVDSANNHTQITLEVYGWNPFPPKILINEFTAKGSKRHPDKIELLVLNEGNTAGMCLYDGVDGDFRQRCILPPLDVNTGDYLIVHCTDTAEETSSVPQEYQLFMEHPTGLSANNGVLTLYTSPHGRILDAVLYSNRFSDSDTDYHGFGSKSTLYRAQHVWDAGEWLPMQEENSLPRELTPEHAIRSEYMTATRTACRSYPPSDTNTADDWHIVPTSAATFGEKNTNDSYVP